MSTVAFSRQQFIVPDSVHSMHVAVVGCGAVGRPAALALSAMGVKKLSLIDHDHVDDVNMAMQMYNKSDIGKPKVEALSHACDQINMLDGAERLLEPTQWHNGTTDHAKAVFCCVDVMSARAAIFDGWLNNPRSQFFVDSRMLGETIRILVAQKDDDQSIETYQSTLYSDEDAEPGRCTSDGVVYTAMIASGFLCREFVRWAQGGPIVRSNYMVQLQSLDIFDM